MCSSSNITEDPERDPYEESQTQRDATFKSLRAENLKVVNDIEDEYRHDLAVHLYSTFLMHRDNYGLPFGFWTGWPVIFQDVPEPESVDVYVDENEIFRDHDKRKNKIKAKKVVDLLSKDTDEIMVAKPSVVLKQELNAYFMKKMHDKIHDFKRKTAQNVEPVVDPPIKIPEVIETKMMNKIDEIIGKLVDRRIYPRVLTWRQFLMLMEDYKSYDKISKLFDGDQYEEIEEEEIEDEEEEEEIEEEEIQVKKRSNGREFVKFATKQRKIAVPFEDNFIQKVMALEDKAKRIAPVIDFEPFLLQRSRYKDPGQEQEQQD